MLRARPGRGAPPPRRRRGRGVRLPARPARAAAARPRRSARAHAQRRAVRRRPRALRARRAARARRPPRPGRGDAPRQRPVRARARAASRARRCRSPRSRPPSRARSAATCRAPARRGASPCSRSGIALERFRPIPRAEARARLGLDPAGPYLLFPHDPARPLKRFDRAREAAGDVPLLHDGRVAPDEVPVLDQRRQRGARPVAGRGLRAVGDRGARVRRARVRHAGRDPPRRAARDRGRALRAVGRATRWRAALAPVLADARPAGRRPRPGRAVLRRPDGRSRRRGLARGGRRTRTAPRAGRRGDRPILGGSSASATALRDRP